MKKLLLLLMLMTSALHAEIILQGNIVLPTTFKWYISPIIASEQAFISAHPSFVQLVHPVNGVMAVHVAPEVWNLIASVTISTWTEELGTHTIDIPSPDSYFCFDAIPQSFCLDLEDMKDIVRANFYAADKRIQKKQKYIPGYVVNEKKRANLLEDLIVTQLDSLILFWDQASIERWKKLIGIE